MKTIGLIVLLVFAVVCVCRFVYALGVKLKIFKSPNQLQYEATQMESLAAKAISLEQRINGMAKYQHINRENVPASDAIDLGLSVKWAPVNIGAENYKQSGHYFAWGESVIKGTDDFKPDTSMTFGASIEELNRKGITRNGILSEAYDVANISWAMVLAMRTNVKRE